MRYPLRYRKTQAMGLSRAMVGIFVLGGPPVCYQNGNDQKLQIWLSLEDNSVFAGTLVLQKRSIPQK